MKALTIWQPWATWIVRGTKDIENREWMPPAALLGQVIAIHAGKRCDLEAARKFARWRGIPGSHILTDLPVGAIVGTARCVRACTASRSPWFVGTYGWELTERRAVDPIPCKGAQGLWTVPIDVELELLVRLDASARRRAP